MMRLLRDGRLAAVSSQHGTWAFDLRPGTVDADAVRESWAEDVYGIDRIDWSPPVIPEPQTIRNGGGQVTEIRQAPALPPVVIDCGAHIGAVSVRCALAGAHVLAVEPDERNCGVLWRHAAEGLLLQVMQGAVGAADGYATAVPIGETGMVEVVPGDGEVSVWSLSTLIDRAASLAGDGRARLLKMDIEGGEYEAIAACPSTQLALVDVISAELHGTTQERLGALLAHLSETHSVQHFGPFHSGGQLFARRY